MTTHREMKRYRVYFNNGKTQTIKTYHGPPYCQKYGVVFGDETGNHYAAFVPYMALCYFELIVEDNRNDN